MSAINSCDLCNKSYKDFFDRQELLDVYRTMNVRYVCNSCGNKLDKEVRESRHYYLGLHKDYIQDKITNLLSPRIVKSTPPSTLEVFPMKIAIYCILYCIFTLILILGTTGTLLLVKGYMPLVVLLITFASWILITKKLIDLVKISVKTIHLMCEEDCLDVVRQIDDIKIDIQNRYSK